MCFLQVELYAEYEVTKLLGFLRVSGNYHLGKAHQVCERRDLINETVFLLGRMGNNKQALTLIIERLADVSKVSICLSVPYHMHSNLICQAIEFARIQNDPDLWEDLLKYSESRPGMWPSWKSSTGTC